MRSAHGDGHQSSYIYCLGVSWRVVACMPASAPFRPRLYHQHVLTRKSRKLHVLYIRYNPGGG